MMGPKKCEAALKWHVKQRGVYWCMNMKYEKVRWRWFDINGTVTTCYHTPYSNKLAFFTIITLKSWQLENINVKFAVKLQNCIYIICMHKKHCTICIKNLYEGYICNYSSLEGYICNFPLIRMSNINVTKLDIISMKRFSILKSNARVKHRVKPEPNRANPNKNQNVWKSWTETKPNGTRAGLGFSGLVGSVSVLDNMNRIKKKLQHLLFQVNSCNHQLLFICKL